MNNKQFIFNEIKPEQNENKQIVFDRRRPAVTHTFLKWTLYKTADVEIEKKQIRDRFN